VYLCDLAVPRTATQAPQPRNSLITIKITLTELSPSIRVRTHLAPEEFPVEAVVSLRRLISQSSPSIKHVFLAASLLSLVFLSACGSNNKNSLGVSCPNATGSFSNSSLPAGSQWAYQFSGWFLNGSSFVPYTAAGVFTADGKGHITAGFDDAFGSAFTGTYSIDPNGTGTISVTLSQGSNANQTLNWALAMSGANPGTMYLIEGDIGFNSSGSAYQQTVAAFNAVPTGTFVFRTHILTTGSSLQGSAASVGVMSVNSTGTITALNEDVLLGNFAPQQRTLGSGVFTAPDSTGTGTLTITDSQGLTSAYNYYVIDANDYLFFETDTTNGGLGLGRMEAQSAPGGGFTVASLNGSYVLGSRGDTSNSAAFGVNSIAQFATDGAGNITSGSYDSVRDGSPALNVSITSSVGGVSVAGNGRATVTLNASGTAIQQTLYLVNASRAFFLVSNDTSRVEDGTLDQQVFSSGTTSFSSTDFKGQYALVNSGSISGTPLDRTGTVNSDGNGNVGWAEVVNSGGNLNVPGCLPGTYTVATNGRVALSINNLSGSLVLYLVSPSESYALQGDPQSQVFGGAALQSAAVFDPPGGF
jgi:hypothetical protein